MREMVFFKAGEIVQLKQDIDNKPQMIVDSVPKARMPREGEERQKSILLGVKCYWFTSTGFYQEKTFNSKDLEKLK